MVKIAAGLLAVFGALAIALASVGLYGLVAYSVNERRRELGIRMALGADRRAVLRLVLRDGMTLVLIGVAAGAGLSVVVSRALASLLLGVSPTDPVGFAAAAVMLLVSLTYSHHATPITAQAVAFIGTYLPAHRASRFDPLVALRQS
jgi:ABC-type antimicrobial peptide transport system permease subunit